MLEVIKSMSSYCKFKVLLALYAPKVTQSSEFYSAMDKQSALIFNRDSCPSYSFLDIRGHRLYKMYYYKLLRLQIYKERLDSVF